MADLYPAIRFPQVDFGGLAELPAVAEEYRGRKAVEASLAGLDASDPKALRAAATRAIATGTQRGLEAGIKLHAAAQAQENLAQKSEADRLYLQALPGIRQQPPSSPLPSSPFPIPEPIPSGPPTAAPPLPTQVPAPAFPPPPSIIPGPQGALSPEEAPPYQVAGPPQAPPVPAAPPISPETVQGALARPAVVPQAPQTPTQAPSQLPLMMTSPQDTAIKEIADIQREFTQLGPKALVTPEGRRLMAQYTNALARSKFDDKEISYRQENLRRAAEGLPLFSRADFETFQKDAPDRLQATRKLLTEYQKDAKEAGGVIDKLKTMDSIMKNPQFVTGSPGLMEQGRRWAAEMANTLRAYGFPESQLLSKEDIAKATTPGALREAFTALTNQAVIASLGGTLGKSISDSDVRFMRESIGDLLKTETGIRLIHKFLSQAANKAEAKGVAAEDYMSGREVRASPEGMSKAVREAGNKFAEQNPIAVGLDGKYTDLGKSIQEEVDRVRKGLNKLDEASGAASILKRLGIPGYQ